MSNGRSFSGNLLFLVRDPDGFRILTEKPEEIDVDINRRTWQHCDGNSGHPSIPIQIGISVINCIEGNRYGVIGVYWASQAEHLFQAVSQIFTGIQFQERFHSRCNLGQDLFLESKYPRQDLRRSLVFSGH